MAETIQGKKIAILVTDGFEQAELGRASCQAFDRGRSRNRQRSVPNERQSPRLGHERLGQRSRRGRSAPVGRPRRTTTRSSFPGGLMNPDKLRAIPQAVDFVRQFFQSGKPVAAICHGPWMLVEAGAASCGRQAHLLAGASRPTSAMPAWNWVDEEVVVDHGAGHQPQAGRHPGVQFPDVAGIRQGCALQREEESSLKVFGGSDRLGAL